MWRAEAECALPVGCHELGRAGKMENGILVTGRGQHNWRVGLLRAADGKERPDPRRPHIQAEKFRLGALDPESDRELPIQPCKLM